MINPFEILETVNMIEKENLDIRTITMGISLKSCVDPDIDKACEKVYNKITSYAKDLVKVGCDIEKQYGIPIINKRISVTPISQLVDALDVRNARIRIARKRDQVRAVFLEVDRKHHHNVGMPFFFAVPRLALG